MSSETTLSIIIPVYNERATIEDVIDKVLGSEVGLEKELVVIDDCSSDGTREVLQKLDQGERPGRGPAKLKVVLHDRNKGKGAAIRTGLQHATGQIVLVQDADLEYDPHDYSKLLEPILNGRADVVFGNRFHGGPHRVLYFWHYLGNRFLTTLSNILSNLNLSDMEVGYKVFRRSALDKIDLRSERFGFEPEITMKVARLGLRIYEVPIAYHGRTYAEGKKITWKDGVAAIYWLLKYRLLR